MIRNKNRNIALCIQMANKHNKTLFGKVKHKKNNREKIYELHWSIIFHNFKKGQIWNKNHLCAFLLYRITDFKIPSKKYSTILNYFQKSNSDKLMYVYPYSRFNKSSDRSNWIRIFNNHRLSKIPWWSA